MTEFDLPLSVTDGSSTTALVLELPAALRWVEVADAVCVAAGLPPGTPLRCQGRELPAAAVVGAPPLLAGARLATGSTPAELSALVGGPLVVSCVAGPDAGRSLPVLHDPVVIGRSTAADLVIADPHLSLRHARVTMTAAGPQVTDLGSVNGLSVNGGDAGHAAALLPDGGVLRLGASRFAVRLAAEQPLARTPDGRGHLLVSRPPAIRVRTPAELAPDPGPPPERQRRALPILAALVGALLGGGLALLTGQLLFLAMAAAGPATMIFSAVGDRWSGRRSHRRALAAHHAAAAARTASVRDLIDRLRRDEWDRHPDPATCLSRAAGPSARLWERRPDDPEFGTVTVGVGDREVSAGSAGRFRVAEVPMIGRLQPGAVLGIAGPAAFGVVRSIVLQAATLHAPGDLTVEGPAHLVPAALPHADPARIPRVLRLVVIADAQVDTRAVGRALTTGVPTCVVCTAPTLRELPDRCTGVLSSEGAGATLVEAAAAEHLEPTAIAGEVLEAAARELAPLTDHPPPTVDDRAGADPLAAWTVGAATATLGIGASGPVVLDLERDGPHILVAGTTGAGKSELLITLIAGLAAAAPPSGTSFVLVDYKGGAAFAAAARLPHVAAMVTDLDPALAARGLTSLRAELRRRERFLAAAGAADLATVRHAGRAGVPPRLVIVVDEFATVAAELPQFLTGLLDVAQRGRSLGLHLVLATQRPAGVVSPAVRANISTRICLRVVDETESRDVLDLPDAAQLPSGRPGMALLRRGRDAPVLFRGRLSTSARRTTTRVRRAEEPSTAGTGPSRLDALVAATAAREPARPAPPWLPPLPARLRLPDPRHLGLLDLPDEQAQRPWKVPTEPVLAIGPPGSGRTGLLHRWSAAQAADGAELVLVDAGTGLAALNGWPATSTRLDLTEPDRVLRLLDRLSAEIDRRAGAPGPPIAIAVDGLEPVAALLDQLDFGTWTGTLSKIADRGHACGIRLAVVGGPRARHHRCAAAFRTVVLFGESEGGPGRARLGDGGPELQVAIAEGHVTAHPVSRSDRLVIRPLPVQVRRGQLGGDAGGRGGSSVPVGLGGTYGRDGSYVPVGLGGDAGGRGGSYVPVGLGGDAGGRGGSSVPVGLAGDTGGRGGSYVPVGLGGDDAGPVGWPLGHTRALVIAGPPAAGVTTALRTLAAGAAVGGTPVVWVAAALTEGRSDLPADGPPAGALPHGVRRVAGAEPLRRTLAAHQGPLLLICDRVGDFEDPALLELLTRFAAAAGPQQTLALGARLDHALRCLRGPIPAAAAHRNGLLLSAQGADGRLLGAVLPRHAGAVPPGRGHLFTAGSTQPVQVAFGE